MLYSLALDDLSDRRLRQNCNLQALDYAVTTDFLARMLHYSSDLDRNSDFVPTQHPLENDDQHYASLQAVETLRHTAKQYGLTHREAAMLTRDEWIGCADEPDDYRGRGGETIKVVVRDECGEVIDSFEL